MDKGIKNIIFDLGGVLLDLHFNAPVEAFRKLGAVHDQIDYRKAISDPIFLNFEMGNVSPEEFRDRIRTITGNGKLDDRLIDEAWCSLLGSVPSEKVALLRKLSAHYRLFLYSNTNAIHIEYFKQQFLSEYLVPFESFFEKAFYSHEIHDRKPEISSFKKVITLAGLLTGETLFVDDFIHNIDAARSIGFKVFHYIPGNDLSSFFIFSPD